MRAYTMSGKYVEYVVWPAIYLHKGGAMLSKAVVQGRSEAVNARATYAGPSVMDTFEQTQTIRPISENMSPQNTNRKGDFNKAMIDRSIKTESDINSFTKSMGTASGVSSTQREYYDRSGNSRYNSPKISTQTVDEPRTYTGDFPRSSTPDQWSRYGTDQRSRTGTPTRGKGQSNNSQYPSSKSHSTPHATQISVSREHTANMYQQQKGMGNRNFSQTTHIVHQNRDARTTDSHAQLTNHGRGGHTTSSSKMETNL
ncbi:hypothetical protein FSP39_020892 [Pinctada imbricata]|uniref:Mitochondria-eating protein C-terminal domain-containing protein n=1 Tax=Pinctada imbricata TaxID=66713 RepID=A0AA89BZV7_PINIB|nr:hypothetical protein FSP39_020892 [Pinctada imbricata]